MSGNMYRAAQSQVQDDDSVAFYLYSLLLLLALQPTVRFSHLSDFLPFRLFPT